MNLTSISDPVKVAKEKAECVSTASSLDEEHIRTLAKAVVQLADAFEQLIEEVANRKGS